jgi:hypothetical protein
MGSGALLPQPFTGDGGGPGGRSGFGGVPGSGPDGAEGRADGEWPGSDRARLTHFSRSSRGSGCFHLPASSGAFGTPHQPQKSFRVHAAADCAVPEIPPGHQSGAHPGSRPLKRQRAGQPRACHGKGAGHRLPRYGLPKYRWRGRWNGRRAWRRLRNFAVLRGGIRLISRLRRCKDQPSKHHDKCGAHHQRRPSQVIRPPAAV